MFEDPKASNLDEEREREGERDKGRESDRLNLCELGYYTVNSTTGLCMLG